MQLFKIRRTGNKCKYYCDSYKAALSAVEMLHTKAKNLSVKAEYANMYTFFNHGQIILGVSQVNEHPAVTVLADSGGKWRRVSTYSLAYGKLSNPICYMDLHYTKDHQSAYIEDLHCKRENLGYGSALMSHLIIYLKLAGFRHLTGHICPTDFGHEAKLRHYYSKFGFEIYDHIDHRSLVLRL